MMLLSLFYLSYQLLSRENHLKKPPNHLILWRMAALLLLICFLIQIFLGAWTSTHYAAFSCPDIPFCHNQSSIENLDFRRAFHLFSAIGINYEGGVLSQSLRQTIQMTHRFFAFILSLISFIFIIAIHTDKELKERQSLVHLTYLFLFLFFLQITLGFVNVLYHLPLASAILHNLIAAALLLTTITLNLEFYLSKKGKNND
jgi:cytochrome c oxidase assembly protein subunit 15